MANANERDPLAQFIVGAPLYSARVINVDLLHFEGENPPYSRSTSISNPGSIERYCRSGKCQKVMTFKRLDYNQSGLTTIKAVSWRGTVTLFNSRAAIAKRHFQCG